MNLDIAKGIIILAVIIAAIIFKLLNRNPKDKASKFMDNFSDQLLELIGEAVASVDPKDFSSAEEYRAKVIELIYTNCWELLKGQAMEALKNKNISSKVFNYITEESARHIVDSILYNNHSIQDIEDKFAAYNLENSNIEEKDAELEEEYSDQDKYVEESKDEDLEEAKEIEVPEEEAEKLNPQKDEEEDFNIEDDSMEIVPNNNTVEIISLKDKNGRELYYEVDNTGKKTRVSKDYALSKLSE